MAGLLRHRFGKLLERGKGAPYSFKSGLFYAGAIVGRGANLKPLKMHLNALYYAIVSGCPYFLKWTQKARKSIDIIIISCRNYGRNTGLYNAVQIAIDPGALHPIPGTPTTCKWV
jgi:hypothetical protein